MIRLVYLFSRFSLLSIMHLSKYLCFAYLLIFITLSPIIYAQEFCERAGVSNGWMLDMSSDEMDQVTKACAETKAKYFRADFAWSDVQWNSMDEWNWSNIDRLVQSAQNNDLQLIGILTYFPPWTDQNADTIFWSNFVYEAALRYIPEGVTVFEMWNEPNIVNFFPKPDVRDYVERILIPGANALRMAANQLEVEVTIISGGLAPAATDGINISQLDFVKGIYEYGGKNYFDALGQHPYCWPIAPNEISDYNWFLKTEELREVMIENEDDAKFIWGTEMGWPTHNGMNGVSDDMQAQFLSSAYQQWNDWAWTGPLIWYAYNDAGSDEEEPEDNFGLTDSDFNPKPSLLAFEEMTTQCLLDSNFESNDDFTFVNVFPNPTAGQLFVETGVPFFQIRLFNLNGRQLLHSKDLRELDISELSSGMYYLTVQSGGKIENFKIVLL